MPEHSFPTNPPQAAPSTDSSPEQHTSPSTAPARRDTHGGQRSMSPRDGQTSGRPHSAYRDRSDDTARNTTGPAGLLAKEDPGQQTHHQHAYDDRVPFTQSAPNQRIMCINQAWFKKVKPDIEVYAVLIQAFAIRNAVVLEANSSNGHFNVPPYVLCVPFSEHDLDNMDLGELCNMRLKHNPTLFVRDYQQNIPLHSIIAAKCIRAQDDGRLPPFGQSCHWDACILP